LEGGFSGTQIYVSKVENDLDAIGGRGGAERQLRREILGDLRHILEASGIQFPNVSAVMSDEERRSSLASTTPGGGRPHEDL
jgi:hypothetical protein